MDAGFLLLPEFAPSTPATARPRTGQRRTPEPDQPTVQVRRLAPHAVLFAAGDAATEIHEVAQGAVMVSRMLPDGRRQIVDLVGPGRLFGLAAGDRHDCTAVALTASVICGLDRRTALAHNRICERIGRAALAEIHRLRDLALLLGRKSAIERVASFFLALIGDEAARVADIALPMTRAEIADHLGLTIETVSRNITKLKRLGQIGEDHGDGIRILDVAALRDLAAGRSGPEAAAA